MREIAYNRNAAVEYAKQWAYSRNPAYYNFNLIGGDCTNFASQCLYAGTGVMNFTPDIGWYYRSIADRSAAWTGVEYFWRFLNRNEQGVGDGAGPFAKQVELSDIQIGDFVQFGRDTGDFYHTPIVIGFRNGEPLLSAHSYDTFGRLLSTYEYEKLRCIHIIAARK